MATLKEIQQISSEVLSESPDDGVSRQENDPKHPAGAPDLDKHKERAKKALEAHGAHSINTKVSPKKIIMNGTHIDTWSRAHHVDFKLKHKDQEYKGKIEVRHGNHVVFISHPKKKTHTGWFSVNHHDPDKALHLAKRVLDAAHKKGGLDKQAAFAGNDFAHTAIHGAT